MNPVKLIITLTVILVVALSTRAGFSNLINTKPAISEKNNTKVISLFHK